ncbi:MAG TPA: cysteine--tRNA ligase [Armatimonadota bacterium]|nr:cysteine--tRNA ligase [Armatimonadota bacterium]
MALVVYNVLHRRKEEFIPLHEEFVGMHVCGPTVYDMPHLGHAKTYVAFDVIARYLRHRGYQVLYIQNITDVGHMTDELAGEGEDKMVARARLRKVHPMQLAETYTREYFRAMDALNVQRPDISPRASGHITEIIALVQKLLEKGHAYEVNGSVYFDVSTFPEYGKLSHRTVEVEPEVESRVSQQEEKRHPADFAIWKRAEPGHILQWPSPWGMGFPGWHIECSAMANKYIGKTLDIHGGGVENIFPHNEDEIAQSEAANDAQYVRYWLHTGSLKIGGQNMSKSLGNFVTIDEALKNHSPEALRFYLLQAHYASPIDFAWDAERKVSPSIEEAQRGLDRLYGALQAATQWLQAAPAAAAGEPSAEAKALDTQRQQSRDQFYEAMDDDFNAPRAAGTLFTLAAAINRFTGIAGPAGTDRTVVEAAQAELKSLGMVLGILEQQAAPSAFDGLDAVLDLVIAWRQAARKRKDFALSDQIRDDLQAAGILLEDHPGGKTSWRIAH